MEKDIPPVEFAITSNDGNAIEVDTTSIVLEGTGWLDIRHIRLTGSDEPLDAFWPLTDTWQIEIPLKAGSQRLSFEAVDYQGNVIATDSIDVTTSVADPALNSLRISEIQYHPRTPTPDEIALGFDSEDDFEYIELVNIADQPVASQWVSG